MCLSQNPPVFPGCHYRCGWNKCKQYCETLNKRGLHDSNIHILVSVGWAQLSSRYSPLMLVVPLRFLPVLSTPWWSVTEIGRVGTLYFRCCLAVRSPLYLLSCNLHEENGVASSRPPTGHINLNHDPELLHATHSGVLVPARYDH